MNKVPDNGLCRKGYGSGKDIPTNGIGKGRICRVIENPLHICTSSCFH